MQSTIKTDMTTFKKMFYMLWMLTVLFLLISSDEVTYYERIVFCRCSDSVPNKSLYRMKIYIADALKTTCKVHVKVFKYS